MPDQKITGKLLHGPTSGPARPPGTSWILEGIRSVSLDTILQSYEGRVVEIVITILDEALENPSPRTVRDLTTPRY